MRKELSWLALSVQGEFPTEALADFKTPCPFPSVCAIHGSCIFGPIRTWESPNHTYFMTPWVLHKLSHSHPARQNEFISCWPGIYIPRIFIHPSSPIPCLCPLQWLPGCHLCVQLWFGLDQKTKFKKKKVFLIRLYIRLPCDLFRCHFVSCSSPVPLFFRIPCPIYVALLSRVFFF